MGFVLAVSLPIVGVVILAAVIVVVMRRFHRKRMNKILGELASNRPFVFPVAFLLIKHSVQC